MFLVSDSQFIKISRSPHPASGRRRHVSKESGSIPVPLLSQAEASRFKPAGPSQDTTYRATSAGTRPSILFHVDDGQLLCRRLFESPIEAADGGGAVGGPLALGVCVRNENMKTVSPTKVAEIWVWGRLP